MDILSTTYNPISRQWFHKIKFFFNESVFRGVIYIYISER